LANNYFSHTSIGFFESMGPETVDYIINQTELTSIFVAKEYV
jgi:long-subunit acyl-CoA synthetase (AMP-forming)